MNCFNHPEEVAVASCIDCGKGLCKKCAGLYQMPICNECNLKRVKNDKGNIIRIYLPSILLFVLGMLWGIGNGSFLLGISAGFIAAGIPWGWKIVTFIQPKMFLFLSFGGWVVYFLIKFVISCFAGIVALPIGLVRLIISLVSAHKKEQNINNNLASEQQ
jgi:hypothetical protein